uniref:Uncharacterized protein n=1 Tax=Phage MSP1 TaxID=2801538 RepID=A0AB37G9J4_9VIRU
MRSEGIEPSTSGWQPKIIPFNYERIISQSRQDLNLLSLVRIYENHSFTRIERASTLGKLVSPLHHARMFDKESGVAIRKGAPTVAFTL